MCYNDNGGNKMKKNNILKAIGICFLAYVVLSWIIPAGSFSSGTFVKSDTQPLGLFDIFLYPIVTASTSLFILNALIILLIGGFYSVLSRTGVYSKIVEKVAEQFKNNGYIFLAITVFVFALLSALTGLTMPLLIMVPFFVAVVLKLGYRKIVALLSTFGAILVGNIGSIYSFNINGYLTIFFETEVNDILTSRILLFVLMTFAFIGFVLFLSEKQKITNKEDKKSSKKEMEIPLYSEHVVENKSAIPMVLISIFMIVLLMVGMYNWETMLQVDFFTNIHTSISEFEIFGYPIFKNIIGTVDPLGYWTNYDLAIILFIATMLIAWIYNVKGQDKWKAIVEGVKEMVPVALCTIAAEILFLIMNSNAGTSFFETIANFFISMTKGFNAFTFGLLSAIGGIFFNDFPYLVNELYVPITTLYTDYNFIGIFMQMIHGFIMLIAPTSMILVAGLQFLNISYTEWLKNVWKYLLIALIMIIAFTVLLTVL